MRSLEQAAAQLTLQSAGLLLSLQERQAHARSGFAAFSDFAREILQVAPRTAKRRLALARTAAASEPLRTAFLEGRLSVCQLLALRPLDASPALPSWIHLAESVPVRTLTAQVREALAAEEREAPAVQEGATAREGDMTTVAGVEGTPGILGEWTGAADQPRSTRVTFPAPLSAVSVWEQGLAAARLTLGWNAPAHLCVDAMLSEAEVEAEAEPVAVDREPDPSARTIAGAGVEVGTWTAWDSRGTGKRWPQASATSSEVIAATGSESSAQTAATGKCWPPAVTEHADHQAAEGQPVPEPDPRWPAGCLPLLSLQSPSGLPSPGLTLSPENAREIRQTLARFEREIRTLARRVARAGRLRSQKDPDALLQDYLSLSSLDRLLRLVRGRLLRLLWIHSLHRALGCASLVQFGEVHLRLSQRAARDLVSEAYLFDAEPRLAQSFRQGRIGLTQARLVRRVATRGTLPGHLARAETVTLRQLEREVRFFQRLAEFAPDLWARHPGPFPDPGLETALLEGLDRNRVLKDLETRGLGIEPDVQDPAEDPRRLARLECLLESRVFQDERQTVAPRRMSTITFWANEDLLNSWNAAMGRIRGSRGPLPTWACSVLLVQHALETWLTVDPERRPREHRVLERDDYLCQAPGCSSRRHLEVHHIRFRSRGGPDTPENKITLCHAHHHQALHKGYLKLTGRAPANLHWELGTRRGRPPLWTLRGERILGRT